MTPKGFLFAAVEAAVKKPGRLDMGLVFSETEATAAAVFTKNTVVAAPVIVSRERVANGLARAVLVNSGNANACTGPAGLKSAALLADGAASVMGVDPSDVLVCSTGVIGMPLPAARMEKALPGLKAALKPDPAEFARSIMTTDTVPKIASAEATVGGVAVRVMGIAKGAGMIRPDMATMLCFIVTDAKAGAESLNAALRKAVEVTFNSITIDGDTSTNDTVILLANGRSGAISLDESPEGYENFCAALEKVCRDLSRMIVKDGEGVTKLVDVSVNGAKTDADARKIAFTIAESPLVKTALHGEDPNWGRIAAAMGRSGSYKGGSFDISIGGVEIVSKGKWQGEEAEAEAHKVMTGREYQIIVTVREGKGAATVTTCDFSADYVRINADYRS